MATKNSALETKTCGRCGGSGHYSYCSMYGSRCFGCGGTGIVHTKRGAAALAFLTNLRRVPLGSLKVGDLVLSEGFNAGSYSQPSFWWRVTEIKPANDEHNQLIVSGTATKPVKDSGVAGWASPCEINTTGIQGPADYRVRKGWTAEEKAAQLKLAVEYQATLTKDGKPRKVKEVA